MPYLARVMGRGAPPAWARPRTLVGPACFNHPRGQGRGHGPEGGAHNFSTSDALQKLMGGKTPIVRRTESTAPPSRTSSKPDIRDDTKSLGRSKLSSKEPSPWPFAPVVRSSQVPQPAREAIKRPDPHHRQYDPRHPTFTPTKHTGTANLGFEDLVRESKRGQGISRFSHRSSYPDLGAGSSRLPPPGPNERTSTRVLGFQDFVKEDKMTERQTRYSQDRAPRLKADTRLHDDWPRREAKQRPRDARWPSEEEAEYEAIARTMGMKRKRVFDARIRAKCERRQIAKMYQFAMAIISPGVESLRRKTATLRRRKARELYGTSHAKKADVLMLDKLIAQITGMIELIQMVEVVMLEVRAYNAAVKATQAVSAAIEAGKPTSAVHLQLFWAPSPHSAKRQSTWFPSRLRNWWEKNYLMTVDNSSNEEATDAKTPANRLRRLASVPVDDPRYKPYRYAVTLALQAERAAVEAGLAKYEKTKLIIDIMWERWSNKWEGFKQFQHEKAKASRRKQQKLAQAAVAPLQEDAKPSTEPAEPAKAPEEPVVLGEKTARREALVNRLLHGHKNAEGKIRIQTGPRTVVWR